MIRCNTPEPLADLERLRQEFTHTHHGLLKLIGRRHVRSNNSWMHNYHRLVKGKDRCSLLMHPDDMLPRDIEDGGLVTVSSRVGSLRVRGEASENVMPGVVSLPHGWGHGRAGVRLAVAQAHAGVSIDVSSSTWRLCRRLAGNVPVKQSPVRRTAAHARPFQRW
jgi:anaerobic selenocysteine-containing dehydrogenase